MPAPQLVPAPRALAAALAALALLATALPPARAQPAEAGPAARPRVGLVLGGGGARGAAHIGVLEVLERLRVPVDCVAGTSMGALVAGAWAAGLTPAQMRAALAGANWADMFLDDPDHTELSLRSKRLALRFLPGSEAGVTPDGLVAPPGVVSGQKIKLFFNQLVGADTGQREISALPLPLSIIATDIGSGERVVLREGSLPQAMRASMAVPGLLAPQEVGGRRLVDGGLVDNVPIREVRERCGAQVVIAVNVGSPPLPAEQVNGLLSITAQMVVLLTEQNVAASLATLQPGDIYLKPDLGKITASDFERHGEAADRGRAAAEAVATRLEALSVPPQAYAAWRQRLAAQPAPTRPIDEVQIDGLKRVDTAAVRRHVEQQPGQPLDLAALNRDLLRAYGEGSFERVDYAVLEQDGRRQLRLTPVEKAWGPDYLRFGLRLDSNLSQGSTYLLRAGYQKTWLNRRGGELLVVGELGSTAGASVEWYQPLDLAQRVFVDTIAEYRRERNDYWFEDQRIAEYRTSRSRIDLVLGANLGLLGQVRLGWREFSVRNSLETGIDLFPSLEGPAAARSAGGWLLALDLQQSDRLYFPSRGWTALVNFFDSPRRDYSRLQLELRGAVPWDRYVLAGRLSWVGATRGVLPLVDAARLGGLLNMTGFASGQLIGDGIGYGHVRAERVIGRAPLGLRGDLRLGVALEAGKVAQPYSQQQRDGWLNSVALYLGGESPVGPFFLGVGRGSGGSVNAYLVIGVP